jgi:hypothetical protein
MREAATYFGEAGLRVTRRDYIVFMPRLLKWLRPLEPCLAGVPLGAQYVVIGETTKPIAARSAMEVDVTGGRD